LASRLLDSADADALWRSLPQASTREELDFRNEAANAAACAALFAAEPRVHVPATDPSLSGERVLTMEWVDGAKLDDPAALLAAGVQPAEVAPLLTATFSAMVFEHGFVHCDPHAGNLLARRMPQAGARDGRGGGGGGGGGGAQLAHRSRPSRSHTHTRAHARTHTHSLARPTRAHTRPRPTAITAIVSRCSTTAAPETMPS